MGRAAALILVLFGLVGSGWTAVQRHNAAPKAPLESAAGVAAAAELKDAGNQLYLTYHWAQTYNGPDLKNFKDLTVVRADDYGFCLEVLKGGHVFKLIGPGGKPELGRC